MYISIKEAIKEINYNNYSIINVKGIIELTIHIKNMKAIIDKHIILLGDLNNKNIKINKHQIMNIIQETDKIIIELDGYLKIYILKK